MALEKPTPDKRQKLLKAGLAPLSPEELGQLFPTLDAVFESVLTGDALLHEDVQNPVNHHTTVLKHMMEIAKSEDFSWEAIRRVAAIAILHDIQPAPRITREMRDAAATPEQKAELELKNLQNRIVHMGLGSEKARQKLQAVNEKFCPSPFTEEDIDVICGVIAIHDIPSINLPIPADAQMAVAFREADRLWMQTRAGILADLARKGISTSPSIGTEVECIKQALKNFESYQKERKLYTAETETFRDTQTFFRTKPGHEIFLKLRKQWEELNICDLAKKYDSSDNEVKRTIRENIEYPKTPDSYLDVLSEEGKPTPVVKLFTAVHRDGDWHKGLQVILMSPEGKSILFKRRKSGKFGFIGGHVDVGETSKTAAIRETCEETCEETKLCINSDRMKWIGKIKRDGRNTTTEVTYTGEVTYPGCDEPIHTVSAPASDPFDRDFEEVYVCTLSDEEMEQLKKEMGTECEEALVKSKRELVGFEEECLEDVIKAVKEESGKERYSTGAQVVLSVPLMHQRITEFTGGGFQYRTCSETKPDYATASRTKDYFQSQLLRAHPEIVSIAPRLKLDDQEHPTNEAIIVIGVRQRNPLHIGSGGGAQPQATPIPTQLLVIDAQGKEVRNQTIDVIIEEEGEIVPQLYVAKRRPCPGGYSISHPRVTVGTLGGVAQVGSTWGYILSNNHVLAATNSGTVGDLEGMPL